MQAGQPSRTARGAAAHRAIHQIVEGGAIFADPLAVRLLGDSADELVREASEAPPARRAMRFFVVARSRIAEDALAAAVARGVRQLVVLGAGLDTFAYRNPHAGLRVVEVDHPATQAWKRARLAASGVAAPASLVYAPVDFERDTLADVLAGSGFDAQQPSFFTWLGVAPYLQDAAIFATLAFVAGLPGGAEIVFDYGEPVDGRAPAQRAAFEAGAARVAALGEPWISFFEPAALAARLRALGFDRIDDMGLPEILGRFLPGVAAPSRGGHVMRASSSGVAQAR